MKIVDSVERNLWKEFLKKCPESNLIHTPEWSDFLTDTFQYKKRYIFVLDENDIIIGLMPLFEVKNIMYGQRMCSLPFSGDCGYIGDSRYLNDAVQSAVELSKECTYLEIRSHIPYKEFEKQNFFSTFILDLSYGKEKVWANLKRNVKGAIKKSAKSGVEVIKTKNIEDLKDFYEINCITKKEIGVPCHPWRFFKNMFETLADYSILYLSIYDGEPIAGGIMNFYGYEMIYGYGAGRPDYLKLYPYNAFLWKSIEDACQSGFSNYDFGRSSYDNLGLISFKKRWGTLEKKLFYSYYPRNPGSITDNRNGIKYKLGTKLIRKSPMAIYKNLSKRIFKYFG